MANPIVLIVEDTLTEQYVLTRLLNTFDFDVHAVASGEDALAAMGVINYVAILMDIGLPGIDGNECATRIRQMELLTGRRTPIIALTVRSEQSDYATAIAAGMDDYIRKPFDPEDLRKMLLRWVYLPGRPNLKVLCSNKAEEKKNGPESKFCQCDTKK